MSLLSEIGFSPSKTPIIWCDSVSVLSLAANPVFHSRSKHVELDIPFIQDKVLAKELDVRMCLLYTSLPTTSLSL